MMMWGGVLIVLALLVYIRLAPHDADRWHGGADAQAMGETKLDGGYVWREAADEARMQALHDVIRATPATRVLAGSLEDRRITYVTRTKWIGFPDYTTMTLEDGVLELYGRLRFGRSDLGVNAKRIKGWLAQV